MAKKNNPPKKPVEIKSEPGNRLTATIKIRESFKRDLELVARHLGLDPGILVERQLKDYVEDLRLEALEAHAKKQMEEAEKAKRELEEARRKH